MTVDGVGHRADGRGVRLGDLGLGDLERTPEPRNLRT